MFSLESSAAFVREGNSLAAAGRTFLLAERRVALVAAEEIAGELLASGLAPATYPTHPRFAEFVTANETAERIHGMISAASAN